MLRRTLVTTWPSLNSGEWNRGWDLGHLAVCYMARGHHWGPGLVSSLENGSPVALWHEFALGVKSLSMASLEDTGHSVSTRLALAFRSPPPTLRPIRSLNCRYR